MRNTGQGGRLKTICPETFFDIITVIPRGPELNAKSIGRFSSSCSAESEAVKYSENSGKPEVEFEPNRGEIVFGILISSKESGITRN
ncbi:hypothetical protein P5673_031686 [Acropora cervicornis]|uniref:Uncharacterized protein n=1 Tax=Acropora cervicornis TaxID=6130 RepID=A0AAD9PSA9_ACRCE|nr:hypothetical protein P5673_031686 [Acropora cervicornis]